MPALSTFSRMGSTGRGFVVARIATLVEQASQTKARTITIEKVNATDRHGRRDRGFAVPAMGTLVLLRAGDVQRSSRRRAVVPPRYWLGRIANAGPPRVLRQVR